VGCGHPERGRSRLMKWCGDFGSVVGVPAIRIEAVTLQPTGEAYKRKARPVRELPIKIEP